MYLLSLETALPEAAFDQQTCWDIFHASSTARNLRPRSVDLVRKILLRDNGVDRRHFALTPVERIFDHDAESLNRAFEAAAPRLGAEALAKCLAGAKLDPEQIDGLFVCTCTGYLCPGPSSFIAETLRLRPETALFDLVGQGCGAALPALRAAKGFLANRPSAKVAVVAVEICSAAFFMDDDPGVLISACLFADGAAASIWTGKERTRTLRAHDFDSLHLPEHRERLRFENRAGRLRNRLHRSVPEVAAHAVARLQAAARPSDSNPEPYHLTHGGGREIIDVLESVLRQPLPEARAVLRECGNLSSPSVLFALERHLKTDHPQPRLRLTTFGAGFSAHSCSLTAT